ncbi:sodium ion-translocating decarboxylase subunit beta [Salmonella enterica subsp. enterica serovar Weltevreden]|nr:sodium ion-translocating decarboxylase subunit beta [Salmonella enterica subsp. enterica serovar Weltevreden]
MHLAQAAAIMLLVSLLLLWLAIAKKFEPLLLLPIGFGGLPPTSRKWHGADRAGKRLLAHQHAGQLSRDCRVVLNCAPDARH